MHDYKNVNDLLQKIPIYWINLEKSVKRRERLEGIFEQLDNKATRISAVDGYNSDLSHIKVKKEREGLSGGSIGCALSHLKAIKKAYDDNCDYCIILEDDVNFDFFKYKKTKILDLFSKMQNYGCECLILGCTTSKGVFNVLCRNKMLQVYNTNVTQHIKYYTSPIGGTYAYILNRTGIIKILETYKKNKYISNAEEILYKPVNTFVTTPYFSHPIVEIVNDDNKSFISNSIRRHNNHNRSILRWKTYYSS